MQLPIKYYQYTTGGGYGQVAMGRRDDYDAIRQKLQRLEMENDRLKHELEKSQVTVCDPNNYQRPSCLSTSVSVCISLTLLYYCSVRWRCCIDHLWQKHLVHVPRTGSRPRQGRQDFRRAATYRSGTTSHPGKSSYSLVRL